MAGVSLNLTLLSVSAAGSVRVRRAELMPMRCCAGVFSQDDTFIEHKKEGRGEITIHGQNCLSGL
tara:strand:+ start:344 stop:538 length:195 start_codon:yes stop_codon:yes gene_type:complete